VEWWDLCDPEYPLIIEDEAGIYLACDFQLALAATLRYYPVLTTEPERAGLRSLSILRLTSVPGAAADINAASAD